MSTLELTLSDRFGTEDADAVCAALSEHLCLGKPRSLFRQSADPNLPSVVQLVGHAAGWSPLKVAATAFFSAHIATLAKRAGDATSDGIATRLKNKEARPLADVATTLTETANRPGGKAEIVVGLNTPGDHFCTGVRITEDTPAAVAFKLAAFVVHATSLEEMMLAETAAGNAPCGQVTVEVQVDGSLLVKWRSQPDFKEHERRLCKDAQQPDG